MDRIQIKKGKLGSISEFPSAGVEIKPLTVFIGKQGTGKSLISQLIYFFYNLPYLIAYHQASDRKLTSSRDLIRTVLDNLRSDRRAIGVFADPNVTIEWDKFTINLQQKTRQIIPNKALREYVEKIMHGDASYKPAGRALFVPAERVIFPHAGPSVWKLLSWPSTLILYGDALQNARTMFSNRQNNRPDTPEGQRIQDLSRDALSGEIVRYGEEWRWQVDDETRIDLDMASSGQKAGWSWLLLLETLFDQRQQGLLDEPFRVHIEEPEVHLHPAAQRTMMRILAYLANNGIEVVLTTHSLTMLFELNNLMTAEHLLPKDLEDERVPAPEFRIRSERVSAYLFQQNGLVESLLQQQDTALDESEQKLAPWINEDQLRLIDEELGQELSRIRSYGTFWKE